MRIVVESYYDEIAAPYWIRCAQHDHETEKGEVAVGNSTPGSQRQAIALSVDREFGPAQVSLGSGI